MMCSTTDCVRKVRARGLCRMHYQAARRHGTLPDRPDRPDIGCSVDDCTGMHRARGLCSKHYQRRMLDALGAQPCAHHGCTNRRRFTNGLCRRHHLAMQYGITLADGKPRFAEARRAQMQQQVRHLRSQGRTWQQIADEVGVSTRTVGRWIDEKPSARGTQLVTAELMEEFDFLCSFGTAPEQVAQRLGVSLATIERAKARAS